MAPPISHTEHFRASDIFLKTESKQWLGMAYLPSPYEAAGQESFAARIIPFAARETGAGDALCGSL